mgnify:CR=1 FL=1
MLLLAMSILARTLGELAVLHVLEAGQVFLHRAVTVGGVRAGVGEVAPLLAHGLSVLLVHIGQALLDEVHGAVVVEIKDVGCPVEVFSPVEPEPVDVLLDGVDELHVLLAGVGVVEAQVAHRPAVRVLLGNAEIQADGLGVADVQIPVRLRREARDGGIVVLLFQVRGNPLADEVFLVLVAHARHSNRQRARTQAQSMSRRIFQGRRQGALSFTYSARGSSTYTGFLETLRREMMARRLVANS